MFVVKSINIIGEFKKPSVDLRCLTKTVSCNRDYNPLKLSP